MIVGQTDGTVKDVFELTGRKVALVATPFNAVAITSTTIQASSLITLPAADRYLILASSTLDQKCTVELRDSTLKTNYALYAATNSATIPGASNACVFTLDTTANLTYSATADVFPILRSPMMAVTFRAWCLTAPTTGSLTVAIYALY